VIFNTKLLPLKKVAQLLVLLKFSQKLPKVNSHPIGENSPNLVTQAEKRWRVRGQTRAKTEKRDKD
jgi:hypothetical protein